MIILYKKSTVYVVGHGRTGSDNAITDKFKIFFIGFVIDTENDEIVNLGSSTTIAITEEFIKSIFIGSKFNEYNKDLEEEITNRYFGSSQKAIVIAYKDALKKYLSIKK